MFDHLKQKLGVSSITPSAPAAPRGAAPNSRSIYQSRQNFGVNFGSLFVLEKFIYDEMFIDNATVELDAILNNINRNGMDNTRNQMENHWKMYCSDDDWNWLRENGVQSIRIPIGYWTVNGGYFAKGFSFERVSPIYQNAWKIFIDYYVKKAQAYNISILVDLHAVPKGANTGDHSGEVFSRAGFWNDSHAIQRAIDVVSFIARDLKQYDNISGIQIVNESSFDNEAKGQKYYYSEAINAIRKEDKDIPIMISDGWWADQWVKFLANKSSGDIGTLGVVIDDHVYRCFSDDDKKKSVDQIITDLNSSVLTNLSYGADFIIGEYSCVLDGSTWNKSQGCNRDDKVREYGNKEIALFNQRAKTGSYFWCYKFQHGDGGEWGFRPMVSRGCIPCRKTRIDRLPNQTDYENYLNTAFESHSNYWNSQNPKEKFEHWRFKEGFITGWADCLEFAKFQNSRIGRVVAWQTARRNEHVRARGNSRFVWQWDHGFQEALNLFSGF